MRQDVTGRIERKSGGPADIPTLLGTYHHGVYFVGAKARSLEAAWRWRSTT